MGVQEKRDEKKDGAESPCAVNLYWERSVCLPRFAQGKAAQNNEHRVVWATSPVIISE